MVSQLADAHGAPPTLTLVVPAFNEQDVLERWRAEWTAALDGAVALGALSAWNAVVVDDGSADRTNEILGGFVAEGMALTVVRHSVNRGLGASVCSGLAAVTGDLVLYTDVDLPFDPARVTDMLALLGASGPSGTIDVVSAVRDSRCGEGPRRCVMSVVYNALVRLVLGVSVRDVNFAAKLLRRESLAGLQCQSEGSLIDAELIARLERRGATIGQLELTYQPRTVGVSTLSSWPVVVKMLREMVRIGPSIRAETRAARLSNGVSGGPRMTSP